VTDHNWWSESKRGEGYPDTYVEKEQKMAGPPRGGGAKKKKRGLSKNRLLGGPVRAL